MLIFCTLPRESFCRSGRAGGTPAGNKPVCKLSFSMRTFLAIFLMLIALLQVVGENKVDLATATLAIAAAWFISLFLGD